MDYTREPIVETVITPKDGHRLAVRNSKNPGQEEFVVDALEVITFGANCFFRNLERPRAFMVPASDYEILEVRETKLALKAASLETPVRPQSGPKQNVREPERRKPIPREIEPALAAEAERPIPQEGGVEEAPSAPEQRHERRPDRRRGQRRRRGGRDEGALEETRHLPQREEKTEETPPREPVEVREPRQPSVLPPPQTLIRDDLERLRRNEQYKGAFYLRESDVEAQKAPDVEDIPIVPFNLQDDEPREPTVRPPEEDIYKATPAPSEE